MFATRQPNTPSIPAAQSPQAQEPAPLAPLAASPPAAQPVAPSKTIILSRVSDSRRYEPSAIGHTLTVDRLLGILRSAESGNTRDLFSVYRDQVLADAHIQSQLNTRKLAVLGDEINVTAVDPDDPADAFAAEWCHSLWFDASGKTEFLTHLLDATFWPLSICERIWRPSNETGRRFEIAEFRPVPYHLFDWTTGRLRIEEVDPEDGQPLGSFYEPDPTLHVCHRGHLLTSIPDHWGGPMRAALFWWLFKTMVRGWWVRFLDRFGMPFPVGKYDQNDDASRATLASAFGAAKNLFGLVVSRETEVEMQQVSMQSVDAFEKFSDYADRKLSLLILGQTMTSEAEAAGLGSSQADVHNSVRSDIRLFDARKLGETLREQLFRPAMQINGIAGRAPLVTFGAEDQQSIEVITALLSSLPAAGLQIAEDSLDTLSRQVGYTIERSAGSAMPADLVLSALAPQYGLDDPDPLLALAANGSASLALDLRARHAVASRALSKSGSLEAFQRRLTRLALPYPDPATIADPARAAVVL